MKRWVRWAALLYPAQWQTRYRAEFEALLDDAPLRSGDLADVVRGAIAMQMTSLMKYPKMALLAGLAGAILVGGYSFTIPNRYVCTAALLIDGRAGGTTPSQTAQTLQQALLYILGRDNLIALIQKPGLDLYQKERQSAPVQNVAEDVFRKHVRVHLSEGADPGAQAFRIIFEYPDPQKARAVVEEMVSEVVSWHLKHSVTPSVMSVLENPITPVKPAYPLRASFALLGALGGALLGLVAIAVWRRTRVYAVVTLDIPMDTKQFADRRIAAGEFRDMGEYIRALIRADQQSGR